MPQPRPGSTTDIRLSARARCGYVATTGVYRLDCARFSRAIEPLTPAEAATHMPHPNLWSWRTLLAGARPGSTFLAFFLADLDDPPLGPDDAQFRDLLSPTAGRR